MSTIGQQSIDAATNDLTIIYDGDCPFCASYVGMTRLKKQFDHVNLVNARSDQTIVADANRQGYDLNEGMIVIHKGERYFGAEAMHFLALVTTKSNMFNRLSSTLLSSKAASQLLYPLFKRIRKSALFFLGKPPIGA